MKKKAPFLWAVCVLVCVASFYPLFRMTREKGMKRPDITIWGPILMADGIGRQTVELAQALIKKRHQVQIISNYVNKTDLPLGIRKIIQKKPKQMARVILIEEGLWAPGNSLDRFFSTVDDKDQIRYAYSMLESTKIMPEWVMMMNLYFDAVIVPDPFLVEVYQNSGVTIPVFCIPLAIDMESLLKSPLKMESLEMYESMLLNRPVSLKSDLSIFN